MDCPCPYCDPWSVDEPIDTSWQPYLPFQFPPDPFAERLKAFYTPYLAVLMKKYALSQKLPRDPAMTWTKGNTFTIPIRPRREA